ncbi:hypothetical protein ORV05_19625 [Amycolatopsis cynarae]|uniref:Uncharacterized protein n=1 Tax=Amycolatopsis cynarae TaxID=2995223 RepID=A0ABY7AU62_9PSEU|nr:hypothetical protein [Amycolatopsis sp. HUAS 11-8]WAL63239.1 hypothetical protein ORV05_19625 [Amycolatopsis sp. HUAS 11-8]
MRALALVLVPVVIPVVVPVIPMVTIPVIPMVTIPVIPATIPIMPPATISITIIRTMRLGRLLVSHRDHLRCAAFGRRGARDTRHRQGRRGGQGGQDDRPGDCFSHEDPPCRESSVSDDAPESPIFVFARKDRDDDPTTPLRELTRNGLAASGTPGEVLALQALLQSFAATLSAR